MRHCFFKFQAFDHHQQILLSMDAAVRATQTIDSHDDDVDCRRSENIELMPAAPAQLPLYEAYTAQEPSRENVLSLEWGQLESRNALLTFQSDFRLRQAVSGVYDLTDRLGCSSQRLTLNQRLYAGGLTGCEATEGYTNLTMNISIQLHAPGHKFLAAPELLVSRRNDVVLNKGWHQLFRLQAVGWSKNSSSSVIVFAPTLRCRFLGFENSQHLRFDIILGKTPTAESAVRRLARHKHTHTLLHSAKEPSAAAGPAGSTQALPGNNAKNALRQQLRQMHTAHDQQTHDSESAPPGGPRQFKQLVLKKETVIRRWQVCVCVCIYIYIFIPCLCGFAVF